MKDLHESDVIILVSLLQEKTLNETCQKIKLNINITGEIRCALIVENKYAVTRTPKTSVYPNTCFVLGICRITHVTKKLDGIDIAATINAFSGLGNEEFKYGTMQSIITTL